MSTSCSGELIIYDIVDKEEKYHIIFLWWYYMAFKFLHTLLVLMLPTFHNGNFYILISDKVTPNFEEQSVLGQPYSSESLNFYLQQIRLKASC